MSAITTRRPWVEGTSLQLGSLASAPYAAGTTVETPLRRIGTLGMLVCIVNLTFSCSVAGNAATVVTRSREGKTFPWSSITRTVLSNSDTGNIIDSTPWGLFLWGISRFGWKAPGFSLSYDPDTSGFYQLNGFNNAASDGVARAIAVGNTATVKFPIFIPVQADPEGNFGQIPLQNDFAAILLKHTWADAAANGVMFNFTGGAVSTVTASIDQTYDVFTIPDPTRFEQANTSHLHRVTEKYVNVAGPGIQRIPLDIGPAYQRIIVEAVTAGGGIPLTSMGKLTLVSQDSNRHIDVSAAALAARNFYMLGDTVMPKGCLVVPLDMSTGLKQLPGYRDTIDTANLTELELTLDLPTVGAGADTYIRVIQETLTPY